MEMRIFSKTGEEKAVNATIKARPLSLDITMEYRDKKIVSSFKKGVDFQKALGEARDVARKYFFNED